MKELNFEQMENVQGGTNCFLVGVGYVASVAALGIIGVALWIGTEKGMSAMSYCWNS